jgi:hypothetical protein
VAALRAFPADKDLAHYGCWALLNLMGGGVLENQERVVAAGGAEAIVDAARNFPNDTNVTGEGA